MVPRIEAKIDLHPILHPYMQDVDVAYVMLLDIFKVHAVAKLQINGLEACEPMQVLMEGDENAHVLDTVVVPYIPTDMLQQEQVHAIITSNKGGQTSVSYGCGISVA